MSEAGSVASRLRQAHRRSFVGREAERALFASALHGEPGADGESPFIVLHVFGPGGVGKTSLLREFERACADAGAVAVYLDARNIEPSPVAFCDALGRRAGITADCGAALSALSRGRSRLVILLDTYELLRPLDPWLHDEFLHQLPGNVVLVLAGRNAPSPLWRDDPAWGTLLRAAPLRNLSADESRAFLSQRRVPETQHDDVLKFTHGHPLALSLVADTVAQRQDAAPFQPQDNPDVIRALLERFVQKVPSPAHRAALEACGMLRLLTEGLLQRMLQMPDVRELFDWLRDLSFVEAGRAGLFPHDLAREAITGDVRWRNPDWYAELHKRAREYYLEHINNRSSADHDRLLLDLVFLHRDNAVVRQTFDWRESGVVRVEAPRPDDYDKLTDMVRRHEGAESARCAAHWFAQQPQNVHVFRDAAGVVGFMSFVVMEQADEVALRADPVAWNGWAHLRATAPLRAGERALLFRHWLAADTHQAVSPVQSLVFVRAVQHYIATPKLAYTIFVCAAPELWEPVLAYADLERLTAAEVEMDGKRFGLFAHDWRVVAAPAWFELLAERELAYAPQTQQQRPSAPPVVALSEDDFGEALRDALKRMSRSLSLRGNALLTSRLVTERAGAGAGENDRAAALRALIIDAAKTLEDSPRDVKLYRAFYHTYIKPAASQEAASELIDVPFSSYRRHLQTAADRVTDALWAKELGA